MKREIPGRVEDDPKEPLRFMRTCGVQTKPYEDLDWRSNAIGWTTEVVSLLSAPKAATAGCRIKLYRAKNTRQPGPTGQRRQECQGTEETPEGSARTCDPGERCPKAVTAEQL